ncbi:hypothetical protein SH668x_000263 [Planctomicrobium sp. SH668]|uniref:hypothetical protein n=1 Tax=Planctomicrobium sp. SH668 TaxID=3448126 RepID=UPI003F5B6369
MRTAEGGWERGYDGDCLLLAIQECVCPKLKVLFAAYGRKELPEWVRVTFAWLARYRGHARAMNAQQNSAKRSPTLP